MMPRRSFEVLFFLFQATGLDCLKSHHSGLSMYDKEKFHRQRNSDKNWLFICTVAAEIWKIEWFQSFWWFPRSNPCPWFGNDQFSISYFFFLRFFGTNCFPFHIFNVFFFFNWFSPIWPLTRMCRCSLMICFSYFFLFLKFSLSWFFTFNVSDDFPRSDLWPGSGNVPFLSLTRDLLQDIVLPWYLPDQALNYLF